MHRSHHRRVGAVLLVLVLTQGCQTSSRVPPARSDLPAPLVAELPGRCARWRGGPPRPQITFIKGLRMFSFDPVSGRTSCIGETESFSLAWGPRGDRVLLTSLPASAHGDAFERDLPDHAKEPTWSRPAGKSVIYLSPRFDRLLKKEMGTGIVSDISFLTGYRDVAYHPAGTHIAVAGWGRDAEEGLFLATNEGSEVQRIVRGHTADSLGELEFSQDGRHLYFAADHGDHHDLHRVDIATGEATGDTEQALVSSTAETIYSGPMKPHFAVSPFSRKTTLFYSLCSADSGDARVRIGGRDIVVEAPVGAPGPVGWLPDGSFAFIAWEQSGCREFDEGDLYLWKDGKSTLVVEDVSGAAVRARLPTAPAPPASAQDVVA